MLSYAVSRFIDGLLKSVDHNVAARPLHLRPDVAERALHGVRGEDLVVFTVQHRVAFQLHAGVLY